jgi:PKD repeat protein
MVPNSNDAVAINTINDNPECGDPAFGQYYIDNETGQHVVYDGFTTPLPAPFYAVGGETYHAKLVIGDGSDSAFDSGVFLSVNSLGADSLLIPPSQFTVAVNDNVVELSNTSKYAREWSWDFGNGVVSGQRHPQPVHYQTPGTYTITLVTSNYCCSDTYSMTVEVGAAPMTVLHSVVNSPLACFGDQNASVAFEISGGIPPYNVNWSPDVPGYENLGAGTYEYKISDSSGQETTITIVITQPQALTLETSAVPALEGQSDGSATAIVEGGVAPYTYLWSNGMISEIAENLEAGTYAVTITDANGCTIEGEVVVDMATSLNSAMLFEELQVFPNPVSETINLVNTEGVKVIEMKLIDPLGKLYRPAFEAQGKDIIVQLPDQLSGGLYMLQIKSSEGRLFVARFVKQ